MEYKIKKVIKIVFTGKNFLRLIALVFALSTGSFVVIKTYDLAIWTEWRLNGGTPILVVGKIINIVEYHDDGNLKPILEIRTDHERLELNSILTKKDVQSLKHISSPLYFEYIPHLFDGTRLVYLKNQSDDHVYYNKPVNSSGWVAVFVVVMILCNLGLVYLCLLAILKI